ncbi:MAG TPA: hypothetical protein DD435_00585 [Cyanobacteria bacterium UBA8530]|nr:hypothetical protein [Cyanobacteria bacterium UBA8530]
MNSKKPLEKETGPNENDLIAGASKWILDFDALAALPKKKKEMQAALKQCKNPTDLDACLTLAKQLGMDTLVLELIISSVKAGTTTYEAFTAMNFTL